MPFFRPPSIPCDPQPLRHIFFLIIYCLHTMRSQEVSISKEYQLPSTRNKSNIQSQMRTSRDIERMQMNMLSQQQSLRGEQEREYESFLQGRQVEVLRPELIKQGLLTSYKLYRICSKQDQNPRSATQVSRRFNDFEFLQHQLLTNYGGCVLPRLPQKNFLANLNMETQEFVDIRTRQLQRYLQKLLSHGKVRLCSELRHFLFDQEFDFSYSKGEFSEHSTAFDGLKTITNSVFDITKTVYSRLVGGRERRCEFSRIPEEESELKVFEREVQDLIKVTKEICTVIGRSCEEITLVHELSVLSGQPHLSNITAEQNCVLAFTQLNQQFEQISSFIDNCRDAILRTKALRAEIEQLEDQQAAIELKERENPRNRELDVIRSKIQKSGQRCERWIISLRRELSVYTSEGKTMMEDFVRRFSALKGEVYSLGRAQV